MNGETRAALRAAVDAARRQALTRRGQVTECDYCSKPLVLTPNPLKRFCGKACNSAFHKAKR